MAPFNEPMQGPDHISVSVDLLRTVKKELTCVNKIYSKCRKSNGTSVAISADYSTVFGEELKANNKLETGFFDIRESHQKIEQ